MFRLLKAATIVSSLFLMLATVATGGFAIIDWVEGDRWVGASFWWRNLLLGAAGIAVAVATFRVGLRCTENSAYFLATAVNLLVAAVLVHAFLDTPKFPMRHL